MLEVERQKKIHLFVNSEVDKVSGFVGNFDVDVLVKPSYTTEKCNGCGQCAEICPAYAPSEFDQNLGYRKAAYIAFTQAVPMIAFLDMDHCIHCGLCETVCELNAIDFNQVPHIEKLHVGTIIVSTGWDEYRPENGEFGYGVYPNVLTQLELERLLAPNGPTFGHLIRPSDGQPPKRVLFVQCVGSRDLKHNPYCSSGVCCMTSIKNSKLIKQHDPDTEVTVAYIDIRAAGKAYEEYYLESRKYGVRFVKSAITKIWEDPETHNLKVLIRDMISDNSKLHMEEFDMVILSAALQPAKGIEKLTDTLRLETSPGGFFKEYHARLNTVDTNTAGISLAGCAHGPKSIAETIMQAKGAASSAAVIMNAGKYTIKMIKAVVDPERCSKCGLCVEACPFGALTMTDEGAKVDEIACRGCGICSMECPSSAITVRNARLVQYKALIDNLLYNSLPHEETKKN